MTEVSAAGRERSQAPEWLSYLMPGTDVLRTVPELTDPTAIAIFERLVSANAETEIRQATERPRTYDLAHLNDIHRRLFADVYPFAGQPRYVDTQKPGQTGEPFVHHQWIETYAAAVTAQLRAQDNLTHLADPGQWADRAAYFQAQALHIHPYREGNGRTTRLWIEDLAAAAGHTLDWGRSSPERNTHVAVAAAHADYEPMRALLAVVAGGRVGVDRDVAALDTHDKLQHGLAWATTGVAFGTEDQRRTLQPQTEALQERIGAVRLHLDLHPDRLVSTEQPAAERWRGLAASIHPALTRSGEWPAYAEEIDAAARAGINVAKELPAIISPRRAPEPRQDTPDLRAPTRPVDPHPPGRPPPRPVDPPTAPPPAPRRGR